MMPTREQGPASPEAVARMPLPTAERQTLERERAELPAHVANYERELDATPPENRE